MPSLCLLVVFSSGRAAAHETEAAGSVSAILHVEPNDIVTAGKPSKYEIEFSDTTSRFKLSDCDCQLQTKQDEKVLATSQLQAANDNTAIGELSFPAAGSETEVAISGQPKTSGAFEAFDLEFPVTVKATQNNGRTIAGTVIGLAIVAFFSSVLYIIWNQPKASSQKNSR